MTKSFVEYIKKQPLIFEVFGHFQQQLLPQQTSSGSTACAGGADGGATDAAVSPTSVFRPAGNLRHPPRRLLPPSLPISQPVRSHQVSSDPRSGPGAVTPTNEVASSAIGGQPMATGQPQEVHAKHDLLVWFEVLELGETESTIFFS